jgi:hypothetical protein
MAYSLFGEVADNLVEFGFDPTIVAKVVEDLGSELFKLDGGPIKVVRIDPRKRKLKGGES